MKELVVATRNPGKLKEIRQLLEGHVCTLFSLADFQGLPQIIEDGDTFEKNAVKKARITASILNKPVLADDSGLAVDILDGKPGIHSARFAGEGANDEQNNAKLLAELHGIPDGHRSAAFHCAVALCFPDGSCYTFAGELKGLILEKPRGSSGFGYDPLFFIPEYNKTLAELPHEVKNKISHRGKALANLKNFFLQSR